MRKFLFAMALFLGLASLVEASPRRVVIVQQRAVVVAPVRQVVFVNRAAVIVERRQPIIIRQGLFGRQLTIIR